MAVPNVKLRSARERAASRAAPGEPMSRSELAEAVNRFLWKFTGRRYQLDAHTIARYERGDVRWPGAQYRSGLRNVLGADSDADLGFHPTRRGGAYQSTGEETTSGVALNAANVSEVGVAPIDFLESVTVDTPVPTGIGWTDVQHVRSTARAVAMSENLFGGGLSCESALAQLRWAGRLLQARSKADVYGAIAETVGNLAGIVAFSAFDIANYAAAERCFTFALWCADQGGSWQLRANTLADMAREAGYLGELYKALSLIELAQVRADRITATARAMLSTIRARLLALTGRHSEAQDDVDRADAHFAQRTPNDDPPWLCYYDAAEHQGSTGKALLPIAQARQAPDLAAPRLLAAIRLQSDNYPRSRAFSRIRLASLLMNTGNPREAVSVGYEAIEEAAPMRSQRLHGELAALGNTAARHSRSSETNQFRHDIATITRATP